MVLSLVIYLILTTLSDHRIFSKRRREDEREWDKTKKRVVMGKEKGRGKRMELVEVRRGVNERWERSAWLRIEKEKKRDITSWNEDFLMKIITFWPLVCPEWLNRFLFFLAQITCGDAAFQDMLRAIQNFLLFINFVYLQKTWLWWLGLRDL